MPRRTIRLTAATDEKIEAIAEQRGYSSPGHCFDPPSRKELGDREDGFTDAEKSTGCKASNTPCGREHESASFRLGEP